MDEKADIKLWFNMDGVVTRAPEDQAERTDHASSSPLQQWNIAGGLMQAEAYGPKIRARLRTGSPSDAERHEHGATQLPFPSWCACCLGGEVSGQLNRCCGSDRDVPEMQIDCFFTNCKNSERMSSNGLARVAETCETRDESPSLNLGRGKQKDAIRTVGTDLRVVRLRCESEMTVEMIKGSSVLDHESWCTIKRASDRGIGSLLVGIMCKGEECCDRKRVVQRTNRNMSSVC